MDNILATLQFTVMVCMLAMISCNITILALAYRRDQNKLHQILDRLEQGLLEKS